MQDPQKLTYRLLVTPNVIKLPSQGPPGLNLAVLEA